MQPDDVFAELRDHFSDREVVELTVTVGTYNLVSRFLVALEVGSERDREAA
jgi:alkylhydroperoxidase family enzyme